MTRQEFLNDVTGWYDLKDFCYEYNCDICDDIYDEGARDEEIDYCITEYARDYTWLHLRDYLNDIPYERGFFRQNGVFDWDYMDDGDDFERYKRDVLSWADINGCWDEDEEIEEPEPAPCAAETDTEEEIQPDSVLAILASSEAARR